MVQPCGKYVSIDFRLLVWIGCIALLLENHGTNAACDRDQRLSIGESCKMAQGEIGECVGERDCPALENMVRSGAIPLHDVCSCGYYLSGESVCCPLKTRPSVARTSVVGRPVIANRTRFNLVDRPAVAACARFDKKILAAFTTHILDGIPADWGEFPHMAAIGYNQLAGNNDGPYDFRCGGSLIEEKFVLTAAHCVNNPNSQPAIVRLNVVDFEDVDQMRHVIERRIKDIHIHNEYQGGKKYNDIALLELTEPIPFSQNVRPACLYTDLADPPSDLKHYITGWGVIDTRTRDKSPILLKAPIHVVPLDNCNQSFVNYGLGRQLSRGVLQTQICAHDANLQKDACQGDSGGPLNLVVDENRKTYKIVGIISAGHSCASSTPGLYTRVAAYLDFIERIVWP